MKKTYIQPETDVFHLHITQMLLEGSIEGIEGNTGITQGGEEDDEHNEGDAKEFVFEDDPWQNGSSDNYWE